jgi:hypothetical protein
MNGPTESDPRQLRGHMTVRIPLAILAVLIPTIGSVVTAYFASQREPGVISPANVATVADIRDVREDLRQLRAEFRAFAADVDARQGHPGAPASARP